jgi:hypothetical protein
VYLEGTIVANNGRIANTVTVGGTNASDLASLQDAQDKVDAIEDEIFGQTSDEGTTIIDGGTIVTSLIATNEISVGEFNDDGTYAKPSDIPDSSVTIRDNLEPSSRPDGSPLQDGDIWIDTDDGNNPHVYDGPNNNWVKAYTNIDGGDITTGTIDAGRIDVDGIFATDAQVKSNLTIGSSSASGVLQSYNFSDTEGWQITNQTATFQDGKFRGTFNVESGTLSDLTVTGQLTFPSSYDSSQIRIGSGSNAFFVGDFSLSGSGQGSGFPQISDSVTDSIAGGGAATGGGLGDYNDFGIGGASVTVDVPWDSSATASGNLGDNIDSDTGVELTVYVREKDAGTLVQERKKEVFASLNDSGTASFSFTADSSTDEIEVETDLYANLGADEEFYSDVSISNEDADVNWTNQQDFVGPDGIKYRDGSSNTMFEVDGNKTSDFGNHLNNAHRVTVQEGSIVLKDSSGTKQIVIHPDGYIDFKQQGSGSTNGADFPTPPSGWVRLGGESNDRKLARKSGNGSANDF